MDHLLTPIGIQRLPIRSHHHRHAHLQRNIEQEQHERDQGYPLPRRGGLGVEAGVGHGCAAEALVLAAGGALVGVLLFVFGFFWVVVFGKGGGVRGKGLVFSGGHEDFFCGLFRDTAPMDPSRLSDIVVSGRAVYERCERAST